MGSAHHSKLSQVWAEQAATILPLLEAVVNDPVQNHLFRRWPLEPVEDRFKNAAAPFGMPLYSVLVSSPLVGREVGSDPRGPDVIQVILGCFV